MSDVLSPELRCPRCFSQLHALCGIGDHDTPDNLELEALKDQLRRVSFERNAYRHLLNQIAGAPGESFCRDAQNLLSQFPKDGDP